MRKLLSEFETHLVAIIIATIWFISFLIMLIMTGILFFAAVGSQYIRHCKFKFQKKDTY